MRIIMEVNLMETSHKNTMVMNIHVKTPPKIDNHCAVICMELCLIWGVYRGSHPMHIYFKTSVPAVSQLSNR